jgi:hypothetical protein
MSENPARKGFDQASSHTERINIGFAFTPTL